MSEILKHPTEDEFYEIMKNNNVVFVDFFATWCGPCKMLSPVVDQLAGAYQDKAAFVKVDVDQQEHLASQYNVSTIPTVIIIKDGRIVEQSIGFKGYPVLEQMLKKHI